MSKSKQIGLCHHGSVQAKLKKRNNRLIDIDKIFKVRLVLYISL